MEPDYHQLEFDCRVFLTWKSDGDMSDKSKA
jgi:hypothetical protein